MPSKLFQGLNVTITAEKTNTSQGFADRLRTFLTLAAALAAGLACLPAAAQFADDFDRADAASLGNGWIEKNPQAFQLQGNEAVKQAVGVGYRDNIVYRPASEDLVDVEASIEIQLSNSSPGYPQLFTRVQSATVGVPNSIDGYILYINNSGSEAVLGRQEGASFVTRLATVNISPALNTTDRYRLRLRTTGANPVQADAFVERWNGSAWIVDGQASVVDASGAAVTGAGSTGFGGYVEASYAYDNFSVTDLGSGSNPTPTLTTINPSNATEGGSAFSMTVTGTNFIPGSVVRWNGSDRATTFVSSSELQAAVTAADIATSGSATVSVFNPAPGGGASGGQTFTIDPGVSNNPAPVLTSVNPTNAVEGGSAFALTVNGSDFVAGSIVRWNGSDRATTFVSAGELQANITAADIAAAGSADVTVFSPAPGGGLSAAVTFTIDVASGGNPLPTLAALNPGQYHRGQFGLPADPDRQRLRGRIRGTLEMAAIGQRLMYRPANCRPPFRQRMSPAPVLPQ